MGTYTHNTTGGGTNYRNGSVNSGSHLIGWDSGVVRAEVYHFKTGQWPVTQISFPAPATTVHQGSRIAMRVGISTSATTYTKSSGTSTGYAVKSSGSTTIKVSLKANTTYYLCFFPGVSRSSTPWGMLQISHPSNNFTITTQETDYSRCSAPTILSLDRAIQNPGQNATLSWSGAEAGINLTIGSYDVYRSTSVDGTYTLLGNTTNTSYTVEAPSAGTYYYYKVVTKPAEVQTTYDSDLSSASSGLKGNTVPTAPTVTTPDGTVIPSSGGSITFKVTPGTDIDGQSLTLAYSTTPTGDKISFTSPLTVNLTAAATYYFYTYDGLDYSAAVSKSITKNTKPSISNVTHNSITTYDALGTTGSAGWQLGYANAITPKVSTNKTGTVIVELEYYSSNDTNTWNDSNVQRVDMQKTSISSTTNVVLNNSNIHEHITLGATNIHWRIRLKLNDGIEDSDYVYYPSTETAKYYAIARPSPLVATYNQFGTKDIRGTIEGQVWRDVRMVLYKDTSVSNVSVIATAGGTTLNTSSTSSISGNYRYVDITLPDGIPGDTSISLVASIKDTNDTVTKSTSATVIETKTVSLDELAHGMETIKPFTGSSTFTISTTWPFVPYTTLDSTTLAAYNCKTIATDVIKFVYSSSNSNDGANRIEKALTWGRNNNDKIITTVNESTVYDWHNALGIQTYAGKVTYYCRLEIKNLFGKVVSSPWKTRYFDFKEKAKDLEITSIQWSKNLSSWSTLGANDKVQEGVYLRLNCSFKLYTTDDIKVSMLLKNGSGERSVGCYEFGTSPKVYTPITYPSSELSRATGRSAASNTKSYVYYINTEIADTTTRQWCIKIDNSGGSVTSGYKNTPVVRQCAPTLKFNSCVTDADYYLDYAFTITDNGGGTLKKYLCDDLTSPDAEGGKQEITTELDSSTDHGRIRAKEGYRNWETKTISVKMKSTVTGLYTREKIYYSNAIIVYQISPTIAYRKNQLGINTDSPESTSIVDIHQTTGKHTILIQGLTQNSKSTKFEIDTQTGEIKFYFDGTLKNTVNLKQGYLT